MQKLTILIALLAITTAPTQSQAKSCLADSCTKKATKTDSAVYRINFTKSGGFAGLHDEYSLASGSLTKTEQARLLKLLEQSGILAIDSIQESTKGAADMFQYQLTVQHKGKTHTASYDDGTLPQAYRTLLDYVTKHGQPGGK